MLLLKRICVRCWYGLAILALASCQNETPEPSKKPSAAAEPGTSVALRVLVVNDRSLAEAIERLRGEWREQSGGELTATSKPWAEVAAAEAIDADVIVFPTRYMGELCVRGRLRPVRKSVLEDKALDFNDFFPLVRQRLVVWGGQVMALPLGIDLPVMCYRADFFEEQRRKPPDNWREYGRESIRRTGPPPEQPAATLPTTWEPFHSWAPNLLLLRVATYLPIAGEAASLFDPVTMSPRTTSAPFVRGIQDLVRVDSFKTFTEPQNDQWRKLDEPAAASWQLATGYAMDTAIGLPPAGHRTIVEERGKLGPAKGNERIGWEQVPGAGEAYISSSETWDKQSTAHRVALLGVGDRLAAVTTKSNNAASAFKLLTWLASGDVSSRLARAGGGTMPVRKSLASSPAWYDPKLNASEQIELGKTLDKALGGNECLILPRIPGVDEYMAALDQAVKEVVVDKAEPAEALKRAAEKWEKITEAHGRESQRQAYLKHLGITEP